MNSLYRKMNNTNPCQFALQPNEMNNIEEIQCNIHYARVLVYLLKAMRLPGVIAL